MCAHRVHEKAWKNMPCHRLSVLIYDNEALFCDSGFPLLVHYLCIVLLILYIIAFHRAYGNKNAETRNTAGRRPIRDNGRLRTDYDR